jgi:putative glycosyltransferase (TIGR04372 family)
MTENSNAAELPADDDVAGGVLPRNSRVLRLGNRRLVVSRPNRLQFGHCALETHFALAYGRLLASPVVFTRRGKVGRALDEIDVDGVRTLRHPVARLLAGAYWWASERAAALRAWRKQTAIRVRRSALTELSLYVAQHPDLPRDVRGRLVARRYALKQLIPPEGDPPYLLRRLLAQPLPSRLRKDASRRAEELAVAAGIDPESPLVTVHVRGRGYWPGGEILEKATGSRWDDAVRNAHFQTHFPAVDFLVERGYTVVRLGDPTMVPVARPGLVDFATSPAHDPLVELYCLFRSRFILCGESGPLWASYLADIPQLIVNATDPIASFPIRSDGIYLLKTVLHRKTGLPLSAAEQLSKERLEKLRDTWRYEFVENTPAQILAATQELLELLERGTAETPGQAWYRELVTADALASTGLSYARKWGPDRGFMGRGRLARSLADAWFEQEGRPAAAATGGTPALA